MEYPSTKRMKKRKELDALVSDKKKSLLKSPALLPDRLLKSSLMKPMIKTRGDHQLLRSQDSESENDLLTYNNDNNYDNSHGSQRLHHPNHQKPLPHHQKNQHKQSVDDFRFPHHHDNDDDDDDEVNLENAGVAAGRRRRANCCGDGALDSSSNSNHPLHHHHHQRRPFFCCSRCCNFVLLTLSLLGVATIAWMHLGLKRDVQMLETRLRRLSIGYTKLPPQMERLRKNWEETSRGLLTRLEKEAGEKKKAASSSPEVNRTLTNFKDEIDALEKSVELVENRSRAKEEEEEKREKSSSLSSFSNEMTIEQIRGVEKDILRLRSDLASAAKRASKTEKRLEKEEMAIRRLDLILPPNMFGGGSGSDIGNGKNVTVVTYLRQLEASLEELKMRMAELKAPAVFDGRDVGGVDASVGSDVSADDIASPKTPTRFAAASKHENAGGANVENVEEVDGG